MIPRPAEHADIPPQNPTRDVVGTNFMNAKMASSRHPTIQRAGPFPAVTETISDVDELGRLFPCWEATFIQLGRGKFRADVETARLPELHCSHLQLHSDVLATGTARTSVRGLFVVFGSAGDWWSHKHPLSPGRVFLWPTDRPLDLFARTQGEAVVISLPESMLRQSLTSMVGDDAVTKLLSGIELMPSGRVLRRFREQVQGITSIRRPAGQGLDPGESIDLRHRCLSAVGQLLQNPETATPSARRGERFQVVGEAVEFMDRNLDRPITTVELCDSLCVSRRTIFYAFKEVYGLTPMAFLRAKRLNMVRRELKQANREGISIQQVASRWTFGHSGFAAHYFKLFGELPSQTLACASNESEASSKTTPGPACMIPR